MMRISACITTRNRYEYLDNCLKALWNSTIKPHLVVVSDDSPNPETQKINHQIVQKYPGTKYILGPRVGVCGNRNNAVNAISTSDTDFVAFIDDDICVEPDFLARAIARYQEIPIQNQQRIILSGVSRAYNGDGEMASGKLTFRGYFCATTDAPQTVAIHAAIFPRVLFEQEQWDENIFFGYEDAELCLRAVQQGYKIVHCPDLKVTHMGADSSSSLAEATDNITNYEISVEAARLYVGIKRYKYLCPNPFKLLAFVVLYVVHMTAYLLKRGAINVWPEILRRSHIQRLWQPSLNV